MFDNLEAGRAFLHHCQSSMKIHNHSTTTYILKSISEAACERTVNTLLPLYYYFPNHSSEKTRQYSKLPLTCWISHEHCSSSLVLLKQSHYGTFLQQLLSEKQRAFIFRQLRPSFFLDFMFFFKEQYKCIHFITIQTFNS